MSYNPINWQNDEIGGTKVNATNLNIMDKGIADAHDMLEEHESIINEFVNQQLPEEYVKEAVDTYVENNSAGFATAADLEEVESQLDSVNSEVGELSSEIEELNYSKTFKSEKGGHNFSYDFVANNTYKITNNSSSAISLVTKNSDNASVETITDNLAGGKSITFVATSNATILNVYSGGNISVLVECLDKRVPLIEKSIEETKEDISYIDDVIAETIVKDGYKTIASAGLKTHSLANFSGFGNQIKVDAFGGKIEHLKVRLKTDADKYTLHLDIRNDNVNNNKLWSEEVEVTNGTAINEIVVSPNLYLAEYDSVIVSAWCGKNVKMSHQWGGYNTDLIESCYYITLASENNNLLVATTDFFFDFEIVKDNYVPKVPSEYVKDSEVEEIVNPLISQKANISYVDSAIASAKFGNVNVTSVVNTKGRKMRPIVTFTDDDCREEVYTILKPILDSKGVKASLAIESGEIDKSGYMTSSQIKEMIDGGHDLMFHGYNEINFTLVTIDELTEQLNLSYAKLDEWGIDSGKMPTVSYPQGSENLAIRTWASKHFKCGVDVFREGLNYSPLGQFALGRINFGEENNSAMKSTLGSPYDTNTIDFYKWCVDKAIEENGWLIFMTHAWMDSFDSTQQGYLAEIIDYIKEKNIDILTVDEAIESVGNLINVGDYNKPFVAETDYFVVGCDGTVESNMTANVVAKHGAYSSNTLPNEFPMGKIVNTPINYSESRKATYPDNTFGGLTTHMEFSRMSDYSTPDFSCVYQTFVGANGNQYIRFSNSDGTAWNEWKKVSYTS